MKTLKFTDPNSNYTGFENVIVKVDIENLNCDNCTVYEVYSKNLPLATKIGLDIPAPMVTTLKSLKDLAKSCGLVLVDIEDNTTLMGDQVILSNFTVAQAGGVDATTPSNSLVLTFDKAMPGLTSQSLIILGAQILSAPVSSVGNTVWTVSIGKLTIPNKENISVNIQKWTSGSIVYGALKNAVAVVYNLPVKLVTYTAVQSGGTDGSTSSTGMVITFSERVQSLTAGKITLTGATKGVLTGNSDTTYSLAISTITVANKGNVALTIGDWIDNGSSIIVISNQPTQVLVFKAS